LRFGWIYNKSINGIAKASIIGGIDEAEREEKRQEEKSLFRYASEKKKKLRS
jgi:hypothetical protein